MMIPSVVRVCRSSRMAILYDSSSSRRRITTDEARTILGLPSSKSSSSLSPTKKLESTLASTYQTAPLTIQDVRQAYFKAAKACHPDVVRNHTTDHPNRARIQDATQSQINLSSQSFRRIHLAYEVLRNEFKKDSHNTFTETSTSFTMDKQTEYRKACWELLGIPAEIVEECKRDSKFRQWLRGTTDAAGYWRNFLTMYGGLQPILDVPTAYLHSSNNHDPNDGPRSPNSETRRKRKF